ncbi:MAG: alpha-1,4-glucan--maltose-1-phosphate maltosyltransferase [Aquabacterium sp.]|uniref:alpha-1,4-glucan--maltose-1-phosphate maltosyltransferase n=1 Tax=Aquabacterium sp. TaxID=1872578 RepID=UPI0027239C1C|nr:alpha-1,4-glucan--maltose-1-phosphate maltosyltransferase [Aquabacterium sp.]MDO9004157.1 alpha-1,4-glucan--maltose-1-phosphate maltosyltransferase [Aquabacterium sp.]
MATRTPSSQRTGTRGLIPEEAGRQRAVIDAVLPVVDAGRFAVKAIAGEPVHVQANCFTDGHDVLRVMLCWRAEADATSQEVEMKLDSNDEWLASFTPEAPGRYFYSAVAWVDHFESWRHELTRRVDEEDIRIAALVGAELIEDAAKRAKSTDKAELKSWAKQLRKPHSDTQTLKALALDENQAAVARRHPDRQQAVHFPIELPLVADRERARYSSWYELFPRSASSQPGQHGTFKDVEARLPYVAEMGFDVLYFPPIHPIGREKRKGRNNALSTEPGDVGSPWAIGSLEGGHKDLLPELGTWEDFRSLVSKAHELGQEIAMDIAFQCAPDHPYVKTHPEWFRWRPDGTVQYAENPPKKYQDIYPFNFETEDWRALWLELKSVFDHWISEGVTIFRVDNPHTKAFPFWEWAITTIKRDHPEVLFLAEAFTRPKVMHRLAKLGYSQSYTYFTWRNTKQELTEYFTELSQGPGKDYFRPNVWPNTPDILSEHLHAGGRAVFALRLVLAATLSASYGIYGPAYELLDSAPRGPGSEEYLNSEKYQLRHWGDWDVARPDSLAPLIAKVNGIRRDNPALQSNHSLRFFHTDNDQLIAYSKQTAQQTADGQNTILVIVNLDPHNPQSGWVTLDADTLKLEPTSQYEVHDLLSDQRFTWQGWRNFVILDPKQTPAHVFRLRKRVQDERHFDNFA